MPPGLAQRGGAVHRDHRKAAALARARVVHGLAPEGLDQKAEVRVALGALVEAKSLRGPHDVAAVEGSDAKPGERALHALAQSVEADLLSHEPQEVLVPPAPAGLVRETISLEVLIHLAAVVPACVKALLALGLRALAGGADIHHARGTLDSL